MRREITPEQLGKLWGEARERGWTRAQVHGRASEIVPAAAESICALDRAQMSALIDAVMSEAPWIDPRQLRLELASAPTD